MLLSPGRWAGLAYVAGPLDTRGVDPDRFAERLGGLLSTDLHGQARPDARTAAPVQVATYRLTRSMVSDLWVLWARLALDVRAPLLTYDVADLVAQAYRDAGAGSQVDRYALAHQMDAAAQGRDRRTLAWSRVAAGGPALELPDIAESGFARAGGAVWSPPPPRRDEPAPDEDGGDGGGRGRGGAGLGVSRATAGLVLGAAAAVGVAIVATRR